MMHIVLFGVLATILGLFAFGSARAGEYLIAIPAAVLMAWMLDMFRHAVKTRRRGSAR